MQKNNIKTICRVASFAIIAAIVSLFALLIVASAIIFFGNMSISLIPAIAITIGGICSFLISSMLARYIKKSGAIYAISFGLLFCIIIYVTTIITTNIVFSISLLTKILIILTASCLGCVTGINLSNGSSKQTIKSNLN